MKHTMNLNPRPFEMISDGRNTIEMRLNDEKRRLIQEGDEIEFVSTADSSKKLNCRVIRLHCFPSFEELYKVLPLIKCGYTEENISQADPADMEKYYSKERQAEYGVLGIELTVI